MAMVRMCRPPFDPVSMFKALILQAQHNPSDAKMEFRIRDRLSWMRFLGFDLGATTPDENTIRHFRNRLTETGALKRVMKAFDWQLHKKGYIPMSGQIVDARLIPAPKQRNTDAEKDAIKAGKSASEIWPDEPNKAAQKDTNARWTLKIGGKVRYRPDATPLPMIATPVFGYKSHISIDRRFGFIRESAVTSAAAPDGRMLRQHLCDENTSMEVWADTAYRSQSNEKWLAKNAFISSIHRRKPNGKPMPKPTRSANFKKSSIRARVEHVFAHQKTASPCSSAPSIGRQAIAGNRREAGWPAPRPNWHWPNWHWPSWFATARWWRRLRDRRPITTRPTGRSCRSGRMFWR